VQGVDGAELLDDRQGRPVAELHGARPTRIRSVAAATRPMSTSGAELATPEAR
jgi:hypothetical protein